MRQEYQRQEGEISQDEKGRVCEMRRDLNTEYLRQETRRRRADEVMHKECRRENGEKW